MKYRITATHIPTGEVVTVDLEAPQQVAMVVHEAITKDEDCQLTNVQVEWLPPGSWRELRW